MKKVEIDVFTQTRKDNGEQFKTYKLKEVNAAGKFIWTTAKFRKELVLPERSCFLTIDNDNDLSWDSEAKVYWIRAYSAIEYIEV